MDSPVPDDVTRVTPRRRRLSSIVLALAFAAYAALLGFRMGAYAGGSDSSGYWNNAQLLREGRLQVPQRTLPNLAPGQVPSFTYVPLGFMPLTQQNMVPTYPIGLSLFFSAVASVTGLDLAPHIVLWVHALFGVALMFALAREFGLSRFAATIGALLLGLSPLYLYLSVQALSDVPAVAWCMAAVLWTWHGKTRPLWALAGGAAVAISVLVRPSNLLIAVPIVIALGFNWRAWILLGLGGLPGAAFLAYLNHKLYGSPFATGYGPVEQIFSWKNAPLSLESYVTYLPVLLTPALLLVLGLPALIRRESRVVLAILTLWVVAFFGFYTFYFHTHETWWYLRFVLPAFPALIIIMLLMGRTLTRNWSPRFVQAAAIVTLVLLVGWNGYWTRQKLALSAGEGERIYFEVARWVKARLPKDAVLGVMQTSGALFHYTPFTLIRYDQFTAADFRLIRDASSAQHKPIYAVLFPFEVKDALEKQMPGHWTQVGAIRHVTVWRLDGPEPTPVSAVPWHEFFSSREGDVEVTAQTADGWFDIEHNLWHQWSWSSGHSRLEIETWPRLSTTARFEFAARSLTPRTVTMKQGNTVLWQGPAGPDRTPVAVNVALHDGAASLEFSSDTPPSPESAKPDARSLSFALYDPEIKLNTRAR